MAELLTRQKEILAAQNRQLASSVAGLMFANLRQESCDTPTQIRNKYALPRDNSIRLLLTVNEYVNNQPHYGSWKNILHIYYKQEGLNNDLYCSQTLSGHIIDLHLNKSGNPSCIITNNSYLGEHPEDEERYLQYWNMILSIAETSLHLERKVNKVNKSRL